LNNFNLESSYFSFFFIIILQRFSEQQFHLNCELKLIIKKMITPETRIIDLTIADISSFLDERENAKKIGKKDTSEDKPKKILNVDSVAELTGYTKGYIRQLVFKKEIPYHQRSPKSPLKFLRDEILQWMLGNKHTPVKELASEYLDKNELTSNLKKKKNEL